MRHCHHPHKLLETKLYNLTIQDDPNLLDDGGEVPKTTQVVVDFIPSHNRFFTLYEINFSS